MGKETPPKFVLFWICLTILCVSSAALLIDRIYSLTYLLTFLSKLFFLISALACIAISLTNHFLGREKTIAIIINVSVIAVTVILLTMIGEFSARFAFRDIMSTNDNSSYFCIRGYKKDIHLNSLGYREKEFEIIKPTNRYRIAVIGDSFTFGQGIQVTDRFSNVLEKSLNDRTDKFEVLNFGVPGSESVDHLRTLKNTVLGLHPDFILLQWFINDFEGHDKEDRPHSLPLIPGIWLRKRLHEHSVLYFLANKQWQQIQLKIGMTGNYIDYMKERFGNADNEDVQDGLSLLKSMIQICRDRNVEFGIVLFPILHDALNEDYPFAYLHRYVIDVCLQENVPFLDLREVFSRIENSQSLWVNPLDSHPGKQANLIAATAISDLFSPHWFAELEPLLPVIKEK
ncbi:SGNH/GDSL hydrolase family protein [Thermodesulfobacteriota bacterium]